MTAPSTIEQVMDPTTGEPLEAHYARKDKITEAYIEGSPLTALCGKT